MPKVRFSPPAIRDLERLRECLRPKSPIAAQRAVQTIRQGLKVLGRQPGVGRPIEDRPDEFREWIIDFGNSGHVVHLRIGLDVVTVLAVRHQKEAGF